MLDDVSNPDVCVQLRSLLSNSSLPAAQQVYATSLLERLERGVSIALLGPQGVGKSTLCDAILGTSGGAKQAAQTRYFYAAGSAHSEPDIGARITSVPLSSCALGHVQILDVASCGLSEEDRVVRRTLKWADIVLWCTQDFGAQEAALWANVSDALKDRSFLVLTQADVLARQRALNARIEALQPVVAEEFHSLLPITALQIAPLNQRGVPVTDKQLAASGVKALIEAVQLIVSSGRRADRDGALLFLERYGGALVPVSQERQIPHPPRVKARDAFDTVREAIMARAYDLAELGFDEADDNMSEVLALCGTISEELLEAMQCQSEQNGELMPWCRAFQDASDKVMLTSLENDTRSAADAVTILLQLRRDVEGLQVN